MYAIVAIKHFYGPSVSTPYVPDREWGQPASTFATIKEAWAALTSKDRSQVLSHTQCNTTYYIIEEADYVKAIAPVFYRRGVEGDVGTLDLNGIVALDEAVEGLCHCRPKECLRIARTIEKKAVRQLVVGLT